MVSRKWIATNHVTSRTVGSQPHASETIYALSITRIFIQFSESRNKETLAKGLLPHVVVHDRKAVLQWVERTTEGTNLKMSCNSRYKLIRFIFLTIAPLSIVMTPRAGDTNRNVIDYPLYHAYCNPNPFQSRTRVATPVKVLCFCITCIG